MANTIKFGNAQWATQKDSILAFNDENANFKPLPFTASRASTATRVNKAGLLETVASGIPRVDYLENTKGAYLLEPQSTNLLTYSNDFAGSGYNKNSFVALANQGISPEGLNNASLIYQTANGDRDFYADTPNRIDVFSVYAKSSGKDFFVIFSKAGTNPAWYNLANGTLGTVPGGTTATITPAGNGWYRLTYYRNVAGVYQFFKPIDSNGSTVGTASGTDGALIYGAQLEQSSYPTSYIPTNGTAITRLDDTASQEVPDGIINSSQGVLYAEISALSNEGDTYRTISLNDGSGTNTNRILIGYSNTDNIYAQINNTVIGITGANFNVKNLNKLAVVYNGSVAKFFLNGAQVGTGITTAPTLIGLDNITSSSGAATSVFEGKVKDMKVYNTSLTDAELVTLTKV